MKLKALSRGLGHSIVGQVNNFDVHTLCDIDLIDIVRYNEGILRKRVELDVKTY